MCRRWHREGVPWSGFSTRSGARRKWVVRSIDYVANVQVFCADVRVCLAEAHPDVDEGVSAGSFVVAAPVGVVDRVHLKLGYLGRLAGFGRRLSR